MTTHWRQLKVKPQRTGKSLGVHKRILNFKAKLKVDGSAHVHAHMHAHMPCASTQATAEIVRERKGRGRIGQDVFFCPISKTTLDDETIECITELLKYHRVAGTEEDPTVRLINKEYIVGSDVVEAVVCKVIKGKRKDMNDTTELVISTTDIDYILSIVGVGFQMEGAIDELDRETMIEGLYNMPTDGLYDPSIESSRWPPLPDA